ncbi:hypothetical protein CU098_009485 [Rhizopus stolonifer]|uniref:YEATS domain-containing protein n=1 Tax=Rhizopus stolonifer TaxID=4846 RepID=A0A367KTL8_RHIST|nr:hypothetical protein CU098_009485 [Rhizopus stolonifer]
MDGDKEVKGKLSVILDHVEYILHPTFEDPRRVKKEEPYVLQEKGWGEFDMRVVLYFAENITDPQVLLFDLNFAMTQYSITHTVKFPNASPELIELLAREPLPRKGGKKPMSTVPISKKVSKKKPVSPQPKISKKPKPEIKRKPSLDTTISPPLPLLSPNITMARSPSFTDLSPIENSPLTEVHEDRAEHVYKMSDVYHLNSVHHAKIDKSVRDKWDIPQINMMELAKRMYRMTPEQTEELQKIIAHHRPEHLRTMIQEDTNTVGIDLYSLGKPLLEKLWDYLADMASDDNESFTSQDHHPSDLEFGSDVEYNSDGEIFDDNRSLSDMDEPGFPLSDFESDQEHKLTNGHVENEYQHGSDMDE